MTRFIRDVLFVTGMPLKPKNGLRTMTDESWPKQKLEVWAITFTIVAETVRRILHYSNVQT